MLHQFLEFWPYFAAMADLVIALLASSHAVLNKRDTRAAIGWVGLIWLAPLLGALLYAWLGVNRIKRRARILRSGCPVTGRGAPHPPLVTESLNQLLGAADNQFESLARLAHQVTHRPLVGGSCIEPLINGEQAYPAMLGAIDAADHSIALSTYIFDNDWAGNEFLDRLIRANSRGVAVRVIIDDVGSRYSWPSMAGRLRRSGLPVAKFLPTLIPWRFRYSNLRSHRKILVVDGRIGFTGGINIRAGHYVDRPSDHPVQDLHFRVTGPIVHQLQDVFCADWSFCTNEVLGGAKWYGADEQAGSALIRAVSDGPDEDFESLRLVILGALAAARLSVVVVTPYFLPDAALITALNVAALRGVEVDIVLPAKNNLVLVQWASTALLWQLLERGCRIWLSPPPFDHSKLMVVDRLWSLVGSANWDPRSLRLNFEFNVECYDRTFAESLVQIAQQKIARSRQTTLAEVDGRPLPVRLRDGVARLFSPYL